MFKAAGGIAAPRPLLMSPSRNVPIFTLGGGGARHMHVPLNPRKFTRIHTAVTLLLIAASVTMDVSKYGFGHGGLLGLVPMFQVSEEANVPTWFSSALLLIAAGLLAVIARSTASAGRRYARHWAVLAVVFVLLSLDETAQIHDLVDDRLQGALHPTGVLFYAWVVPAGVFVAALAVAYARFVFSLPRHTRRLVVLAAVLYVAGAIGMEMVAALHDQTAGYENPVTAALTTVEEAMEMFGLVVFIHALMRYAQAMSVRSDDHADAAGGNGAVLRTSDRAADTAPLPRGDVPESAAIPRYPQSSAPRV